MQTFESASRWGIRLAGFDAKSSLSNSGAKLLHGQPFGNSMLISKPVESGTRKQYGVILLLIQFADARVQIATKISHFEIAPHPQQLRLASQAAGTDPRSLGKRFKSPMLVGEKRIAHVFAPAHGCQAQTRRQNCWQVFEAMNRKIDPAIQQRVFNLFCEQSLATNLAQGGVEKDISRGLDDFDDDLKVGMSAFQLSLDPVGLDQR